MNKSYKITIWFLVVVVLLGTGWYFLSPLFLNKAVDEGFPEKPPSALELESMSPEELEQKERQALEEAANMPDTVMKEEMPAMLEAPQAPKSILSGQFRDADSFHKGSGSVGVYTLEDGSAIVRLEDFKVTNGPDLHVLLVENSNPQDSGDIKAGEYIDLGELKGNVGNQNYNISEGVDLNRYRSVVIYCKPFHVVFSVATLN